MYLLRTEKCTQCGACLEKCPISKDPRILNCKQCEDAPCKDACNYGAFYEISPGVFAIDPELCVGCGKCVEACPYDAIVFEEGIAKKCNLCLECMTCPLDALKLVESEEEKTEKTKILGWTPSPGAFKISIYRPSIQEARIINEFLKVHREIIKESQVNIEDLFSKFCKARKIQLDDEQNKGILDIVKYETRGFSVLTPLLKDPDLEEIAVIGGDIMVFKREGGWVKADLEFADTERVIEIANKMAATLDRRLTLQNPRMNATLPNGSRLHAAIPPITKAPSITIRKFNKRPFSPRELIETGTISPEALSYLWILMLGDLNLVISGSTGSGKTTTLTTLMSFIPDNQRIIAIEETPEIQIYHPHNVRLIVNKERKITMQTLVEDTLRMRPDKVIVGEVREEGEVKAWINTMLAGQGKGSIATFHALSGKETLNRLRSLGVLDTDLSALHLVLVQRRWTDYKSKKEIRRVCEISEILWDGKPKLVPIFTYSFKKDRLERTKNKSRLIEIASQQLKIKPEIELKARARFLENSPRDFEKAFKAINNWTLEKGGGKWKTKKQKGRRN